MEPAPFFADIADADPVAHAVWVTAPDGAHVRVAELGHGERGTVLLFPGRTEFVEKYGRAGQALASRGYTTLALDWRGQGLTDRFLADTRIGHIERFDAYQHDVAALLEAANELKAPRPWHLLGHSMGGGIGLRALYSGLPVTSAVFSGPMWGIRLSPVMRPVAWAVTTLSRPVGLGGKVVPTSRPENYLLATPFEDNQLTGDPEMYAWMQHQLVAHPELALGGPSMAWVNEALREVRRLRARPPPDVPGLCIAGELERIVDVADMRARMANWPGGRLVLEKGARHEVMMERSDIRDRVFDTTCAHFNGASGQT